MKTHTFPKNIFSWMNARFSTKKATGRFLTIGAAFTAIFMVFFLGIAEDVIFKEPLVQFDQAVLQSVPAIRTAALTNFFGFITFLGSWPSIVLIAILTIGFLLRKKQTLTTALFFLALIISEITIFFLKLGVGRVRPDVLLQLVSENNFSFPSGHTLAATVVFGFLAYLIAKSFKNIWTKIAVYFLCFGAIVLVGLSRIYLGVHFPSDVVASMALGGFFLSIFITIAEINEKYFLFQKQKIIPVKELISIPFILILFSLCFHSYFIVISGT